MPDYEPLLRSLDRSISWLPCEGACQLAPLVTKKGTITVPSDYSSPEESVDLTLTFWRYSQTDKPADFHVFYLAGGPGGSSVGPVHELLSQLGSHRIAYYHMHHRGLGESSRFVESGSDNTRDPVKIRAIIEGGPFPAKHLTAHNASIDVSAIFVALQKESDFNPKSTFHVFGESYGGLHTNQVVRLAPNLYDSAFVMIPPALRGTGPETGRGLAENCEKSPFCRHRLGPNPWASIKTAIKTIVKVENECSQKFFSRLTPSLFESEADRLQNLFGPLLDLAYKKVDELLQVDFEQIQYILAFIKATGDCLHPEKYEAEVLDVIQPYLNEEYLARSATNSPSDLMAYATGEVPFDSFVNMVVFYDQYCYAGPMSQAPADHYDLYMNLPQMPPVNADFYVLNDPLKEMKHTENFPLKSPKTRVFVSAGRIDLITPYPPIWDMFNQIEAPEKTWILNDSQGHESEPSHYCWVKKMAEFLGITKDPEGIKRCTERYNKENVSEWTFESHPAIAKIWDHIRRVPHDHLSRTPKSSPVVPNYARVSTAAEYRSTARKPTPVYFDSLNPLLLAFRVITIAVGLAMLVIGLYRWRRSKVAVAGP